jgi:hypothetical protein
MNAQSVARQVVSRLCRGLIVVRILRVIAKAEAPRGVLSGDERRATENKDPK